MTPSDRQTLPLLPQALLVDLRSDTVTQPTLAMYERMRMAPLGDDGLDGDPTARELEAVVAHELGKEAALFVPTATMANLLAALSQAERQAQVVLESTSHMFTSERGGATLTGLFYAGLPGVAGAMDVAALEQALAPSAPLRTALVCMETTHTNAGGAVLPLAHMQAVSELARSRGACVHLDGARLFNAAVALDLPVRVLARTADTVSLCLSKGLSAPAGALLAGPQATVARARRLRRMLGGTQRQVGVMAAAGLEAVQVMPARLAEDHDRARRLSQGLNGIHPALRASAPATNIVLLELPPAGHDSSAWVQELGRAGVLVRAWGDRRLRLVTHRHTDDAAVEVALAAVRAVAGKLMPSGGSSPLADSILHIQQQGVPG
ncbi:MAG: threonine aldolase [Ramlibacter sp.]|nr:threonine aldolase [Ramlibacter sp.]